MLWLRLDVKIFVYTGLPGPGGGCVAQATSKVFIIGFYLFSLLAALRENIGRNYINYLTASLHRPPPNLVLSSWKGASPGPWG